MIAGEDDDLRLQRAAASLQSQLEILLPKLVKKRKHDLVPAQLMYSIARLIEPFQEDPQLLDAYLQTLLPPLVANFLESLHASLPEDPKKGYVPLTSAICYILNLFCKVRGEKVIKGFLNNEPRNLEPILDQIDAAPKSDISNTESSRQDIVASWVQRYVLLLWLSHLMLAPFPLDSLSTPQPSKDVVARFGIQLPSHAPGATLRVLVLCLESLQCASKERGASAALLARLSLRPDMQKLGMLRVLVQWAIAFIEKADESQAEIHHCLGVLSFLSSLVASADTLEVSPYLETIYRTCRNILQQDRLAYIRSSALARKLIVKLKRNIVIHALRSDTSLDDSSEFSILENVIEFLLEAVADSDSPVRYAASKALSMITLKLDPVMADEVIDATLESLSENVYWQGSKRQLSGVNPLRWHGLTLALSHLVFRKAVSIHKLPDALNALLLSLGFEQRSPTGGSIGTNVRDAACFGIWALSRRYASSDLLNLKTTAIRAFKEHADLSVPQALAVELISAACLDPAGNIRRGSSAALQELIGRHPNTVEEGITLVQIVDFHAVGLRRRAMCDVAAKTANLLNLYWESLFQNLLGWRGTGSLDLETRLSAAMAIGLLSSMRPAGVKSRMADQICDQFTFLAPRKVEERQGLLMSLAAIIDPPHMAVPANELIKGQGSAMEKQLTLVHLWHLLENGLNVEDKAFTSAALRPELTASSSAHFIAALSVMTLPLARETNFNISLAIMQTARILNLCLSRHEDSVLEAIKASIPAFLSLLSHVNCEARDSLISDWLDLLENEASYDGVRCSGHTMALGAAYSVPGNEDLKERIIKVLTFRCTAAVAVEARIVALRALNTLIQISNDLPRPVEHRLCAAFHIALNDYTITERGDVGSHVRIGALDVVRSGWAKNSFGANGNPDHLILYADVIRISLERLDKGRVKAAEVLNTRNAAEPSHTCPLEYDVSSEAYFLKALQMLEEEDMDFMVQDLFIGFASSAGLGSESVLQSARRAFLRFVDALPDKSGGSNHRLSLLELSNCIVTYLKRHLVDDRISIPILEVLVFLFDMNVFQRLAATDFNFQVLLSLTQKSHYRSTQMRKLELALDLYQGLGSIAATRSDTIRKVTSMLLHPFAKIRMSAAETLWFLTQDESLLLQDWSLPGSKLKSAVDAIKNNRQIKSSN